MGADDGDVSVRAMGEQIVTTADYGTENKVLAAIERIAQGQRAFYQELGTKHGVTPLQIQLLELIADGAPPTGHVGELAREVGVTQPSASEAIASLEDKGHVSRAIDPSDRRRSVITLTEQGRGLAAQLSAARETIREALGGRNEDENAAILSTLVDLMGTFHNAGIIGVVRACSTCSFLSDQADGTRFCDALKITMASSDLRVNCRLHVPIEMGAAKNRRR
jgi:DNA-binding MarR family transcriptional regulator